MLQLRRLAIIGAAFFIALSGCSGGGSGQPSLPPASQSPTMTLSASVALPIAGGYSGTATFDSAADASAVTVTSSTTAPVGFSLSAARKPASGTLSEFYFVNMVPTKTITLPSLPSIQLKIPASYLPTGKQFYYALSLPTPAGVYQTYRTEGPGNVALNATYGNVVNFGVSSEPYTLTKGVKYTFAFYALSSYDTPVTESLLWVANSGSDSLTAYPVSATGDVAPVRTIAGANTYLREPTAITSDAAGNLYVVNADVGIVTFPKGANGNTSPSSVARRKMNVRTVADATAPTAIGIAIDPVDSSSYLAEQSGSTYEVDGPYFNGSYISFTVPLPPLATGYKVNGLAIDNQERILIFGAVTDSAGNVFSETEVFAPHPAAFSNPAPIYYIPSPLPRYPTGFFSSTYSQGLDRVITAGGSEDIFDQQNASNAPIIRHGSFALGHDMFAQRQWFTTGDPAGKRLFIGDGTTNEIYTLTGTVASWTQGPDIWGPDTQLSSPTSMTIVAP